MRVEENTTPPQLEEGEMMKEISHIPSLKRSKQSQMGRGKKRTRFGRITAGSRKT